MTTLGSRQEMVPLKKKHIIELEIMQQGFNDPPQKYRFEIITTFDVLQIQCFPPMFKQFLNPHQFTSDGNLQTCFLPRYGDIDWTINQ